MVLKEEVNTSLKDWGIKTMGTQVELMPGADQPRLHGMVQQARGDR